jgi:hypothetical protein
MEHIVAARDMAGLAIGLAAAAEALVGRKIVELANGLAAAEALVGR